MTRRSWGTALAAVTVTALATVPTMAAAPQAAAARNFCGPKADTVAPHLTKLTLSRTHVDVSKQPRNIVVTAGAVDTAAGAAAGIRRLKIGVGGPHQQFRVLHLHRIRGTANRGTWQATLTIPTTAVSGKWHVASIRLDDRDGNKQDYERGINGPVDPSDPTLHTTWDQSFTVTGTPTTRTGTPGTITDFTLSRRAVDTTAHTERVLVSARFSSPQPIGVTVDFLGRGRTVHIAQQVPLRLTEHHRWAGSFRVHRWVGSGRSNAHLYVHYGPQVRPRHVTEVPGTLRERHLPTGINVTSGADTHAPRLKALTVSPQAVDTTTHARTLSLHATIADPKSGTAAASVTVQPKADGSDSFAGRTETDLRGDGDQWSGSVPIAQCVGTRSWRVAVRVMDRAGNFRLLRHAWLRAHGLASTFSVTSDPEGDTTGPTISDATASAVTHTFTVTFDEGVKNVTPSTVTLFDEGKAMTDEYSAPLEITSVSCANGTGSVPCDGSGGLATSATLVVPDLVPLTTYDLWANQDNVASQLTDGPGNPMYWSARVALATA